MRLHDPRSFYPASGPDHEPFIGEEISASKRIGYTVVCNDPEIGRFWTQISFGPIIEGSDGMNRRVVIAAYGSHDEDGRFEKIFFFEQAPPQDGQDIRWAVVGSSKLRPRAYHPRNQVYYLVDEAPAATDVIWQN